MPYTVCKERSIEKLYLAHLNMQTVGRRLLTRIDTIYCKTEYQPLYSVILCWEYNVHTKGTSMKNSILRAILDQIKLRLKAVSHCQPIKKKEIQVNCHMLGMNRLSYTSSKTNMIPIRGSSVAQSTTNVYKLYAYTVAGSILMCLVPAE